eukprot:GDKI01040815.1.p1 GENE.GDKI01040815.1~~GDKI01040815.1.p1  ORF type:complete len:321 (+),score=93.98 GDKI01040815.1:200-1162(+)
MTAKHKTTFQHLLFSACLLCALLPALIHCEHPALRRTADAVCPINLEPVRACVATACAPYVGSAEYQTCYDEVLKVPEYYGECGILLSLCQPMINKGCCDEAFLTSDFEPVMIRGMCTACGAAGWTTTTTTPPGVEATTKSVASQIHIEKTGTRCLLSFDNALQTDIGQKITQCIVDTCSGVGGGGGSGTTDTTTLTLTTKTDTTSTVTKSVQEQQACMANDVTVIDCIEQSNTCVSVADAMNAAGCCSKEFWATLPSLADIKNTKRLCNSCKALQQIDEGGVFSFNILPPQTSGGYRDVCMQNLGACVGVAMGFLLFSI